MKLRVFVYLLLGGYPANGPGQEPRVGFAFQRA